MAPFRRFQSNYIEQINQYEDLVESLGNIPDYVMPDSQTTILRDSCLWLAKAISLDMAKQRKSLTDIQNKQALVLQDAKRLNDYAMKHYDEIRNDIFISGDKSYFTILQRFSYFYNESKRQLLEKYNSKWHQKSEWRGPQIGMLLAVVISYILIAIVLSFPVIRWCLPKRFVTDEFRKKLSCIIIAVTAAVFGIAMFIISQVLNDHYFMIMAAQLLAEYSLLVVMIMLSLIVRLKGDVVKSGIRLYTPIMFVGLLVFVYRIVFMPTIAINLTLPPILLLCAIWQLVVITRSNRLMPRSDMVYTWFSFAVLLVATVMSWVGYTLMLCSCSFGG